MLVSTCLSIQTNSIDDSTTLKQLSHTGSRFLDDRLRLCPSRGSTRTLSGHLPRARHTSRLLCLINPSRPCRPSRRRKRLRPKVHGARESGRVTRVGGGRASASSVKVSRHVLPAQCTNRNAPLSRIHGQGKEESTKLRPLILRKNGK